MKCINLAVVSVDTTAGGTEIFSVEQAKAALAYGMEYAAITPSVDIVLIDPTGGTAYPNMPNLAGTGQGAVVGTAANSPWTCPAGTVTLVKHRGGPLRAISTSGTSTVKISAEIA